MSRKMLMDAAHPEEIRVIIATNNQIDDYDYQTEKKSTKGNIYLAKVTRVEPSLQAAFIDYGAEKHGFLPFAEIHPDYYQIPLGDREKLLAEIRSSRLDNNENSREEGSEESQNTDGAGREERPQFYRRYKIQEVVKKDQV